MPFSRAASRARRRWHDRAPGLPWRSRTDRVLGGLAGGIAEWIGWSSVLVRALLAFALVGSGFGPVLYVGAAVLLPESDRSVPPEERGLRLPQGRDLERSALALVVALGVTLLLRVVGIWMGGDLSWPAALAAAGVSLAWSRTDEERRAVWRSRLVRLPGDPEPVARTTASRRATAARLVAGAILFLVGAGWVLGASDPGTVAPVFVATMATAGGVALLAGPWVSGLWRDLAAERRARIRTEERAEVAAQLHDSVLQTLALIQRHPETTRSVARLARQQERSLRAWLFADEAPPADDDPEAALATTFAEQLRAAVHDVEDHHEVAVELVVVGDLDRDARTDAVVGAAREAVANAARHSGADAVSVFAEVTPEAVTVFVRDRGEGFAVDEVPEDRRGVRESIVGRLARHGGTATVTSAPGEGTEVALELPRRTVAR